MCLKICYLNKIMDENQQIESRDHFVYVIRRPYETGDNRMYIGVSHFSKRTGPKERFKNHKRADSYIGKIIRKHRDLTLTIFIDSITEKQAYGIEEILVPASHIDRKKLKLLNQIQGGYHKDVWNTTSPSNRRKALKKKKKKQITTKFCFCDPNGIIYSGTNIKEFSRKHKLDPSALSKLNRGIINETNGWTCPAFVPRQRKSIAGINSVVSKPYKFISPDGTLHEGIGFSAFCKEQNISYSGLYNVWKKKKYQFNGWTNPDSIKKKKVTNYTFISPENKIYNITNLEIKNFAETNNLKLKTLQHLRTSTTATYNNWTIPEKLHKRIQYTIVDPSGIKYKTYLLDDFKIKNLIPEYIVTALNSGKITNYKGWTLNKKTYTMSEILQLEINQKP